VPDKGLKTTSTTRTSCSEKRRKWRNGIEEKRENCDLPEQGKRRFAASASPNYAAGVCSEAALRCRELEERQGETAGVDEE
jgi:hypothetical protein